MASSGAPSAETKPAPAPPAAATPAPPATAPDERNQAYHTFREHFDARRFTEALPPAQKVVELSEQRFGTDDIQLVVPLTNLATTDLRLSRYDAAIENYRRAVKIVEMREGGLSRRVVQPLLGLGTTYFAAQQYQESADALRRAVDTSRKIDGLFSSQQMELVNPLIESYIALNQLEDAEREQQYALRLAETVYGRDDLRMLPTLERVAGWCEVTGRYRMSRQAHARALDIVGRKAGKRDLRVVNPLRGIARTYRLEYLYGTLEDDPNAKGVSSSVGGSVGPLVGAPPAGIDPRRNGKLDPDGEDALKLALTVLKEHPDAVGLRGATQLDLGDWFQIRGDERLALGQYKEAWASLSSPGGPGVADMSQPVQLYYHPPGSAAPRDSTEDREIQQQFVDLRFTVNADGRVTNIKTAESTTSDSLVKAVQIAVRRAHYRPRFVDGNPVETTDVRMRQQLYVNMGRPGGANTKKTQGS